jgi:peptide/nickel transport system ATP-binding protein
MNIDRSHRAAPPPVLAVRNLATAVRSRGRQVRVVRGVSFDIQPGEVLGIVGESGSGKSMTALSVMGLLPRAAAEVVEGEVAVEGKALDFTRAEQLRQLRGDAMAMIFQEPMTSLNPVLRIGQQVGEPLRAHGKAGKAQALTRAIALLERVGIRDAAKVAHDFPHSLSGGMRQRAMIAMAMASSPRLLIADEPTTALDVTVQAQVLDLIDELRRESGTAVLLITHNFGIIARMASRVAVMYAGVIVEEAPVATLLSAPRHPYTRGLLACIPRLGASREGHRPGPLQEIRGTLPDPARMGSGCAFAPRCASRVAACSTAEPPLVRVDRGHQVRCIVHAPGEPA